MPVGEVVDYEHPASLKLWRTGGARAEIPCLNPKSQVVVPGSTPITDYRSPITLSIEFFHQLIQHLGTRAKLFLVQQGQRIIHQVKSVDEA